MYIFPANQISCIKLEHLQLILSLLNEFLAIYIFDVVEVKLTIPQRIMPDIITISTIIKIMVWGATIESLQFRLLLLFSLTTTFIQSQFLLIFLLDGLFLFLFC